MINKKWQTFRTVLKSNSKIVERGKINTPNTYIHVRELSCVGTGTSVTR